MKDQPEKYIKIIEGSINELKKLDSRTDSENPKTNQYIGTGIHSTLLILCASANGLDGGIRTVKYNSEEYWKSHMSLVNRIFIILIHTLLEKAFDQIISDNNYRLESSINKDLNDLIDKAICSCGTNNDVIKKLSEEADKCKPNFNDKLHCVTILLRKKERKKWHEFFECLNIIRNKCAHSNCNLEPREANKLKRNGFAALVSGNDELQMNTGQYPQICSYILDFFDEITISNEE